MDRWLKLCPTNNFIRLKYCLTNFCPIRVCKSFLTNTKFYSFAWKIFRVFYCKHFGQNYKAKTQKNNNIKFIAIQMLRTHSAGRHDAVRTTFWRCVSARHQWRFLYVTAQIPPKWWFHDLTKLPGNIQPQIWQRTVKKF